MAEELKKGELIVDIMHVMDKANYSYTLIGLNKQSMEKLKLAHKHLLATVKDDKTIVLYKE